MSTRQSAVAGQFYPVSCEAIESQIQGFNAVLDDNDFNTKVLQVSPRAVIVPHAGYIYSGFTANLAYKSTALKRSGVKRVVVIGPSHRVYIKGASIALFSNYATPCGEMTVDLASSNALNERFDFLHFIPDAHHEHSTEVQMPFIKHYFPEADVVEIIYGEIDPQSLSLLIDKVLEDKETLVVISTDLSHFHTKKEAQGLDALCIQAMRELKVSELNSGCEACGMLGVKAVIESANRAGLKSQLLDYRTSADMTKDESSVVGYVSALIG